MPPQGNNPRLILVPEANANIDILSDLSIERYYYATISYMILLQYCYEHNETILNRISKPDISWISGDGHLLLMHNSANQLHVIPEKMRANNRRGNYGRHTQKPTSLLSVLDLTETVTGRRFHAEMLTRPLTSPEQIELYYAQCGELVARNDLLTSINTMLKRVPDMDRSHRRLALGIIKPHEFTALFRDGYMTVANIFTAIRNAQVPNLQKLCFEDKLVIDFNTCLTRVAQQIDFDKLEKCTMDLPRGYHSNNSGISPASKATFDAPESFLRPGVDDTIERLSRNLVHRENELQSIMTHLRGFLPRAKGTSLEIERNGMKKAQGNTKASKTRMRPSDVEGEEEEEEDITEGGSIPFLYTTHAKGKNLKDQSNRIDVHRCGNIQIRPWKAAAVIVTSDKIEACCVDLENTRVALMQALHKKYVDMLEYINQTYSFFSATQRFIAQIDYIHSNAYCAIRYKYHRPTIDLSRSDGRSYVHVEEARHPLVERIIDSEYIPNDVSLGMTGTYSGMLLYGLNSSGKTTLAKMMGALVVMGQAGMWVPGKMTYRPYNKIITRLTGEDNLLSGKSSFVVEMMELRTVLRNADAHTLVVADEISRGTESLSASGITIATILTLLNRKASFILSTHLHNLPATSYLTSLDPSLLRICHLTTTYSEELHTLLYERKLKDGQGSSLYGIEVAKSLDLDRDFINMANDVRKTIGDLGPMLVSTKKSRYNQTVYVDACIMCGGKTNLTTHHIHEQHTAGSDGFIGNFHKNSEHNLAILCSSCHQSLHKAGKELEVKQTINGKVFVMKDEVSKDVPATPIPPAPVVAPMVVPAAVQTNPAPVHQTYRKNSTYSNANIRPGGWYQVKP